MSEKNIFENACLDAGLFACDYGTSVTRIYDVADVAIVDGTPCFRHGSAPLFKGSRDDATRYACDAAARRLRERADALRPEIIGTAPSSWLHPRKCLLRFAQRYANYAATVPTPALRL